MSSGSAWVGLPMVRIEDVVLWGNRITALEEWCDSLETMLLKHTRGTGFKHATCECKCHVVPRETEELNEDSIYYQTLVDLAAPEAGVGPESDHGRPGGGAERHDHQ